MNFIPSYVEACLPCFDKINFSCRRNSKESGSLTVRKYQIVKTDPQHVRTALEIGTWNLVTQPQRLQVVRNGIFLNYCQF